MTQMQIAYLSSLSMIDIPETEEDMIGQAYARMLYIIDNDRANEITDAEEYLFLDQLEEEL